MSSIFQNKHLIHIAAEVIILSAVVIYFHLQNQKLTNHIKEIVKKLEEQDELLKKHDMILQRLLTVNVQSFQNPGPILRQPPPQPTRPLQAQQPIVQEQKPARQEKPKNKTEIKVEAKPVVLNLDTSIKEVEEESESENEEDLDEEIANELKELEKEENDEIVVE
jgi:hypothetical protein